MSSTSPITDASTALNILRDNSLSPDEQTKRIVWELYGGDFSKVKDWLETTNPQLTEEERKKAADVIAIANVQAEMSSSMRYINERRKDGDFLEGSNWDIDLGSVRSYFEGYYARFDAGLTTPAEKAEAAILATEMKGKADTPEKRQQIAEDPILRRANSTAIKLEHEMMIKGQIPEKYKDLSSKERVELITKQIEEQARKNPKEFDKMFASCDEKAMKCMDIISTEKDKVKFSLTHSKMHDIMSDKYAEEYATIGQLPIEERKAAMEDLQNKAISEIAAEDPEAAKLLQDTLAKFESNENSREGFQALYSNVTSYFSNIWNNSSPTPAQESTTKAVAETAIGIASPVAGASMKIGGLISDVMEKPEVKAAMENVKKACSCDHEKPKVEQTPTTDQLAKIQSGDTPAKPATDQSIAQNPSAASPVRGT